MERKENLGGRVGGADVCASCEPTVGDAGGDGIWALRLSVNYKVLLASSNSLGNESAKLCCRRFG